VLIYPVLCSRLAFASYEENATAPMLQTEEMRHYWRLYLGGEEMTDNPYAAPLAAPDLTRLPPALILTAGHDPARDDGLHYARRLGEAGVAAEYRCAGDLAHGYLRARRMSRSAEAEFEALCSGLAALVHREAAPSVPPTGQQR
jgi:acetyl esterase